MLDREEDRAHPTKRLRPIASGAVSAWVAATVGVFVLLVVPAISFLAKFTSLANVIPSYEMSGFADGLWNPPYSPLPKLAYAALRSAPALTQFVGGRLDLRPGSGEPSIFVVRTR